MNVTDKGFDYACFNRPYWRQWFERVMNADERLQEIERAQLEAGMADPSLFRDLALLEFLFFSVINRSRDELAIQYAQQLAANSTRFGSLKDYLDHRMGTDRSMSSVPPPASIDSIYDSIGVLARHDSVSIEVIDLDEVEVPTFIRHIRRLDLADGHVSAFLDVHRRRLIAGRDSGIRHRVIGAEIGELFGERAPDLVKALINEGYDSKSLRVELIRRDHRNVPLEGDWMKLVVGAIKLFGRYAQYVNGIDDDQALFAVSTRPRSESVGLNFARRVGFRRSAPPPPSDMISVEHVMEHDLHAYPATMLVKLAKGLKRTSLFMQKGEGELVRVGPSVMDITALEIYEGDSVKLFASGQDRRANLQKAIECLSKNPTPPDEGGGRDFGSGSSPASGGTPPPAPGSCGGGFGALARGRRLPHLISGAASFVRRPVHLSPWPVNSGVMARLPAFSAI